MWPRFSATKQRLSHKNINFSCIPLTFVCKCMPGCFLICSKKMQLKLLLTSTHPAIRDFFCLLEWWGERDALPESCQAFEVAETRTSASGLVKLYLRDLVTNMSFKYVLPTYLNDIFVTKSFKYNLRTENNIPNFYTVRYGKHSIRYFGPYLLSKLPNEIRNISSLTTFRSRIRKTTITELVDNSNCQNCYLCL